MKHLLTIEDCTAEEIEGLFARAAAFKAAQKAGTPHRTLVGKTLGMIFEKPSTRTRVSFEVGMFQLGGHALHLHSGSTQLGRGETFPDTARVLSRYVDGLMVRTFEQHALEELARHGSIPVINGLTDHSHPCQVLTDLFTVREAFADRPLQECRVAYVGDGNNMAHSWIEAAIVLKFPLTIATPEGYAPAPAFQQRIRGEGHAHITMSHDPVAAVTDAHVVNTDTWISMGQEGEGVAAKKRLFAPFQINASLMAHAAADAIVLHCLPAHRGEEITDAIMDGPQSRIFDEAENRLHVQKAILEALIQ
jgi:ornithine carbamoyltransferase